MLLHELLMRSERDHGGRTALIYRDLTVGYTELAEAVGLVAAGMAAQGIVPGDRIALYLPNCPSFVVAYYAASLLGITVVPVNPLLKPAELAYIWRDAEIKLVVTAGPLLPAVQAARSDLPKLRSVVSITPPGQQVDSKLAAAIPGLVDWSDLISAGKRTDALEDRNENDCAVILYTSGTTGYPKGAMLSHRNLTRNVEQVQAALNIHPHDRFLTVLPLFHAFAGTVCMNLPIAAGAASVLLDSFMPGRTLDIVAQQEITLVPAVPAIFNALLHLPAETAPALPHLRYFISGGAPLPEPTLYALEARFGVPVLEGDGPTECSPVTSVNREQGPRKINSVGPPLPGVDVAIFDETDQPLPPGSVGEIVVRGDNVMLGYLNQPVETQEAMRSGWYHTGDLGKIDEDGYVFIVDRKKDMIITAGLNVYPREVEEALQAHSAVAEAAVIGQPDALRGEEVLAVIVRKPDANVTDRDLIHWCRDRLADYKTPRRILFREALPKGGTGKVVKRLLKKELDLEIGTSES